MDSATYAVESQIEQTHWWFVVRRKLFRNTIRKLKLAPDAAILDIGTSTGTNLRMLREMGFTDFVGLDSNEEAVRWCAEKGFGTVMKGDACELPFPDARFDLVLATDIVEHVERDVMAMQEIRRVLKPGGRAIITVPAFESLWGTQDEIGHHVRRYTRDELLDKLKASGCTIYDSYYFNFLLFAPIWVARRMIRFLKPDIRNENQLNSAWINRLLKAVFSIDVACAPLLHVPFGVSIYAMVGCNDG